MSLKNNGNVGIGTTSPTHLLQVNTSDAAKPGGGSWVDSSDQRLKTNITSISGTDALAKLAQLNPVTFSWINPSVHGNEQSPGGFVAQQIAQVFPDFVGTSACSGADCSLVGGDGSSTYNLNLPFKFDAYLVAGIQELNLNLESVAGTITPIPGSASEAFMNNFWTNVKSVLTAWLADAGNGIASIFAKQVNTETLCVSDASGAKTCINKSQLDALLTGANNSSNTSSGGSGSSSTASTASSTSTTSSSISTPDTTTPTTSGTDSTTTSSTSSTTASDITSTPTTTTSPDTISPNPPLTGEGQGEVNNSSSQTTAGDAGSTVAPSTSASSASSDSSATQ
jgi:hypothetical protein